jgi:hypothetical protein
MCIAMPYQRRRFDRDSFDTVDVTRYSDATIGRPISGILCDETGPFGLIRYGVHGRSDRGGEAA